MSAQQSTNEPTNTTETPSYSGAAKFLWEVPKNTPLEELPELYERWNDESQQSDLDGWSK